MKKRIGQILKYNKCFYAVYYYIFSCIVNIIRVFIRTDNNLILFNSYAGRKFDDSPKSIFEAILKDQRFKDYKLVWAFHEPEKHQVEGAQKVKTDGLSYFITALRARVWITNSSVERGLSFKGKKTFYLNTWHGTPLKKMGTDISKNNSSFHSKGKTNFDIMMSQGHYDTDIFSRSFNIPQSRFLQAGLPRNDILANYTSELRDEIRSLLTIPPEKKVILYCPTFREYEKDENYGVVLIPPMNIKKWECALNGDYILLFRAHYEVSQIMNIEDNAFVRNMTNYPNLNDLIIASDILISDYSSVFFDYSITGKPMFYFTYDYDKYSENRGMYFDIRNELHGGSNEDDIIKLLKNIDLISETNRSQAFREKYINFYGNAASAAIEIIAKELGL